MDKIDCLIKLFILSAMIVFVSVIVGVKKAMCNIVRMYHRIAPLKQVCFMWLFLLIGCAVPVKQIVIVDKNSYRTEDGLSGGSIIRAKTGHRYCVPYRIDKQDPTIYIECPPGNLQIFKE